MIRVSNISRKHLSFYFLSDTFAGVLIWDQKPRTIFKTSFLSGIEPKKKELLCRDPFSNGSDVEMEIPDLTAFELSIPKKNIHTVLTPLKLTHLQHE